MGTIRDNEGNFVGELDNREILGKPFICVYEETAPRADSEIIEYPITGNLRAYFRFEVSEKLSEIIKADNETVCSGTIVATKHMVEALGLDTTKIAMDAINDMVSRGVELVSLASFIAEKAGINPEDIPCFDPSQQIYIANTKGREVYGAGILAVPCVMQLIRDRIGDFYIIPSSVHEILCVPAGFAKQIGAKNLRYMTCDTNSTCVEPRYRLSNDIFIFDEAGLHVA